MGSIGRPLSSTMALIRHTDWIEAVALERNLFGTGITLQGRWKTDELGLTECLRSCAGISVERVGLFLPRESMMLRRVDLPAAAQASLAEVLEFEVERHFPIPSDELLWGFRQQGPERQGRIDILLAGAQTDRIDELTKPFDEVNVPIDLAAPLAPMLIRMLAQTGSEQADVVLLADTERCEVAVGCRGQLLASQTVDRSAPKAHEKISATIQELLARHQMEVAERGVNRLFWVSHSEVPSDLDMLLQNDTGACCLGSEVWAEMLKKQTDLPAPEDASPLTLLIALELQEPSCLALDILHRPARRKPRRYDLITSAILLVLLLAGLGGYAIRDIMTLKNHRAILQAEVDSMKDRVERVTSDEKELFEIGKTLDRRQALVDNRFKPLEILSELSILLGEDTYLNSFNLNHNSKTISISGMTENVNPMVEPLSTSSLFHLDTVPTLTGKRFTLQLKLPEKSE